MPPFGWWCPGDAGPPDRCACPQQGLIDPVDVGRVEAERDVRDLLEVGVLGAAACALRIGEAHTFVALFGDDLDEQQHGLGQRLLAAGQHLRIADWVLQRQHDVRKREVADAVGHQTPEWYDELTIHHISGMSSV